MLTPNEIETRLKALKPVLAEKFHVRKIGYFGSYAKGLANDNSDLDLLVEFETPIGWNFFTLENYLENFFGIPVDLVTEDALKSQLRSSILSQVHFA